MSSDKYIDMSLDDVIRARRIKLNSKQKSQTRGIKTGAQFQTQQRGAGYQSQFGVSAASSRRNTLTGISPLKRNRFNQTQQRRGIGGTQTIRGGARRKRVGTRGRGGAASGRRGGRTWRNSVAQRGRDRVNTRGSSVAQRGRDRVNTRGNSVAQRGRARVNTLGSSVAQRGRARVNTRGSSVAQRGRARVNTRGSSVAQRGRAGIRTWGQGRSQMQSGNGTQNQGSGRNSRKQRLGVQVQQKVNRIRQQQIMRKKVQQARRIMSNLQHTRRQGQGRQAAHNVQRGLLVTVKHQNKTRQGTGQRQSKGLSVGRLRSDQFARQEKILELEKKVQRANAVRLRQRLTQEELGSGNLTVSIPNSRNPQSTTTSESLTIRTSNPVPRINNASHFGWSRNASRSSGSRKLNPVLQQEIAIIQGKEANPSSSGNVAGRGVGGFRPTPGVTGCSLHDRFTRDRVVYV